MKKPFFIIVTLGLVLAACGGKTAVSIPTASPTITTPELQHLRLSMGYIADIQFAPFYVAADKGYFADAGLDIEFDYGFETDGMALVGANELPFAIVSGEQVILARAQDVPVVYVMEWFQRYPIAIVSKAAANIRTPADFVGRSVGLPGFFGASYVGYVALLHANGLSETAVNASDVGYNQIEALLTGQSEAVVGYINNEPVQLTARGEAINVIDVADYVDLVANGIITNEETIASNPDLVQRFVRAVLRGLADTLADPVAAFEMSKKYVEGLEDGRITVLQASLPIWQADQPGVTDPASWVQTQEVLLQMGLLDAPVANLEAAYTNQFVLGGSQSVSQLTPSPYCHFALQ